MEFNRYRRVVLAVMLVLALGFLLLRQWQGPGLPGYRIAPMPLVQTVVATGRIVSVSRAQIGSELTGVVLERRVQESDKVSPGTILLVLRSDDLAAQVRQAEAALSQLQSTTRPQAKVTLDRKALADLAATDAAAFTKLVELAQGGLKSKVTSA